MTVPAFFIKSESSDFLTRQKSLFECLDSVEKYQNSSANVKTASEEIEKTLSNKRQKKITKHFKKKESLFNLPIELPARFKKRNRVPDFQKNPHKWTKYSLEDVSQYDMSNESNTAVALAFLKDLKSRPVKPENVKMEIDDLDCKPKKEFHFHQFNKSIKSKDKNEKAVVVEVQPSSNAYFKNSKYIMAEYVVGEKKKNKKDKGKTITNKVNIEKGKEIFLNHIHEYEDE